MPDKKLRQRVTQRVTKRQKDSLAEKIGRKEINKCQYAN